MGRKSKLKKQRKASSQNLSTTKSSSPKGDIETLNRLGYGEHNRLRSPEIPADRPEPQL